MPSAHQNPFAPTDRMLRQFSGLWIVVFGAAAGLQEFQHARHVPALTLAALAITIGPLGLMWPRAIKPIFIAWMALAYPIGWVVSRVVLGIVFHGLFTPVALIFRAIGRDALRLKPRPEAATFWLPKARAVDKAQYLRQF
jgi:hypothetical protein